MLKAQIELVFVEFTLRAVFHVLIMIFWQIGLGTKMVPLFGKVLKTGNVSLVILRKDIKFFVSYEQDCRKSVDAKEIANVSLFRACAVDLCNSDLLFTRRMVVLCYLLPGSV